MTLEDLTNLSVGDGHIDPDPHFRGQQQQQSMEMQAYNPFAVRSGMSGTWDAMCMERMLTIKKPVSVPGEIWITESGFAETLSLLPLNKPEQRQFWKKFRRIQMLASGELNKNVVASRQDRLMMELVSQKSRKDVIEGGNLNERESWITTRQQVEQTLRTPPMGKNKGFFGSVADGLFGSR